VIDDNCKTRKCNMVEFNDFFEVYRVYQQMTKHSRQAKHNTARGPPIRDDIQGGHPEVGDLGGVGPCMGSQIVHTKYLFL
jgi:hypothetical protein